MGRRLELAVFCVLAALYVYWLAWPLAWTASAERDLVAVFNVDESAHALVIGRLFRAGSMHVTWESYGHLHFNLSLLALYAISLFRRVDFPTIIVTLRAVPMVCAAGTLVGVFVLGRLAFGRAAGWLAAAFQATMSPSFLALSFISHPDVPQLCFFVLAMYFCCRLVGEESWRWGWVYENKEPLLIYSPNKDKRFHPLFDVKNFIFKDIYAIPLISKSNEFIGILELINKRNGKYSKNDFHSIKLVAEIMQVALNNTLLFEEEKDLFESLISVMAETLDARHPVTIRHSVRLAKYAVGIAKEMGFPEERLELIRISALLHDYGKIIIPDYILRKKGPLTPEEYEIMKEHPLITNNILKRIRFPEHFKNVPLIAAAHHERINGKGYPYGQKGDEIPLEARILAVCDVFDAITSAREYHEASPYEVGREEIIKGSGIKYDSKVVKAFIRYYDKEFRSSIKKIKPAKKSSKKFDKK